MIYIICVYVFYHNMCHLDIWMSWLFVVVGCVEPFAQSSRGSSSTCSGARPTDDISIECQIWWNFAMLLFIIDSADRNEILYTSQCNCRDVCKISLWSVEHILNRSTPNFDRISNSIEIPFVGRAPDDRWFSPNVGEGHGLGLWHGWEFRYSRGFATHFNFATVVLKLVILLFYFSWIFEQTELFTNKPTYRQ